MDAVWRCRGRAEFEGSGDSGRGSMPSCSGLRYGDGADVSDAM